MWLMELNEATAARRRIPIALVDDTDGKTAETGVTLSAGDLKISKNGAAEANHGGTLTELAGGDYYYELSSGEVDTVGYLTGRLVKTGIRTFRFAVQVVAFDPYTAYAVAGSAMALTSGERNSVADALLDRADAVETGLTPRGAMRLGAAADAGKTSGMATTTATLRNAVADSKARITATVDEDGNRTAVTTDVT